MVEVADEEKDKPDGQCAKRIQQRRLVRRGKQKDPAGQGNNVPTGFISQRLASSRRVPNGVYGARVESLRVCTSSSPDAKG